MRETPIRWLDSWVGFVRRSLARNIGEGKQARATTGRDGHSPLNKGLMMSAEFQLLPMLVGDYEEVMALWNSLQGVRANETREEFARILARNEGLCSVVRRGNELAAA